MSNPETADLKPCPFCGEAAGGVFEHGGPNDHWVVECSACRGEYSEEGCEAAITGWNRRVSPMSSNPEIAEVARRDELLGNALGDIHMAYDRGSHGDWLAATTYLRLALDQMEEAGVTGQ